MYWLGLISFTLVGAALMSGAFVYYRRRWPLENKTRHLLENITLALLGLFFIFIGLELFFKLFFAQTDSYTFTLAAQNWYSRHWNPINSLGYRDQEWLNADVANKTKVMVVGDSFVAGTGIENYQDRFSDQLAKMLGPDYVVFNVSAPGWSTQDEIEAVISYPYKPDILILSYFINDIEKTAYAQGVNRPQFVRRPAGIGGFLIDNSYALNFIYWRWFRLTQPVQYPTYLEWTNSLYQNPELWWRHQQELLEIISGAAAENIELYAVVFPNLADIETSQSAVQMVIDFFQGQGVPVLNVTPMLAGRSRSEIVANALDPHPNKQVNLEVAERLYQMIVEHQAEK